EPEVSLAEALVVEGRTPGDELGLDLDGDLVLAQLVADGERPVALAARADRVRARLADRELEVCDRLGVALDRPGETREDEAREHQVLGPRRQLQQQLARLSPKAPVPAPFGSSIASLDVLAHLLQRAP